MWVPTPVQSANGFRYYVLFVNHFIRFTWIYQLKSKFEVFSKFVLFKAMIETQFSSKIKTFRFNGGGEYTSFAFKSYLLQHFIIHQISCHYTLQQNGLVERKHRHLIETTITLLSQASISTIYWLYVVLTVVSLINLLPTYVLNFVSSWYKLYSFHPDLSRLKLFGCACYPHLKPYTTHKLEPRTKECLFLGYSSNSEGYLCLDVQSHHLYTSRHVLFNESKFPFTILSSSFTSSSSPTSTILNSLWLSNLLYLHSSNQLSLSGPYIPQSIPSVTATPSTPSLPITQSTPPMPATPSLPHSAPLHTPIDTLPIVPITITTLLAISAFAISSIPPIMLEVSTTTVSNLHPMQTRSKSGITKPNTKLCYKTILDYTYTEPPSFRIASKNPKWCKAMDAKFQALKKQNTWNLVPAPPHANLVGCK